MTESLLDAFPDRPNRMRELREWMERERLALNTHLPAEHRLRLTHASLQLAFAECRSEWSKIYAETYPGRPNPFELQALEAPPNQRRDH